MNNKTTLHFFCGKMAAGKSTLAKALAKKHDAILLVEDEWLSELYPGEITNIPEYLKYSSRLQNVLLSHIKSLLSSGLSVVLDFPANTKNQRNWFRLIFEETNIPHILHFVDKSDEKCKQQLKIRNKNMPEDSPFTTEKEFDAINKYFQAPLESEGFNIVRYD
ncbi:MAG: ATP-binding protein [Gammaproteobacteria bacterium]|nr:ATP-binding protein [Gammaproteobacteria bacterium]MCW8987195.1 ATP-binding protein [Gammaproteobacteria bacterium]